MMPDVELVQDELAKVQDELAKVQDELAKWKEHAVAYVLERWNQSGDDDDYGEPWCTAGVRDFLVGALQLTADEAYILTMTRRWNVTTIK